MFFCSVVSRMMLIVGMFLFIFISEDLMRLCSGLKVEHTSMRKEGLESRITPSSLSHCKSGHDPQLTPFGSLDRCVVEIRIGVQIREHSFVHSFI